jgi:hypothetical protein
MPTKPIEMKECPTCGEIEGVICLEPEFELAFMQETLDRAQNPIIGEKIRAVTIKGNKFLCCDCGLSFYQILDRRESHAMVQDRRFIDGNLRQVIDPASGLQRAGAVR